MRKFLCLSIALMCLVCGLTTIPVSASASIPEPDAFQMVIDANNQISNGTESIVYVLSEMNGAPTVCEDLESGEKYISINKNDNKALFFSMYSNAGGNQAGLFWKYFWNYTNYGTVDNDLSFTWEFLVRVPEMGTTPDDFANVFGYRAGEGGFGFSISDTEGAFVFANGKTGNAFVSSELLELKFPMEVNKWYHCVLTYNHSTKIMNGYVNGVAIADDSGATDIAMDWFVASHYAWSSTAGMGIGIAPERSSVAFDSDIGIFNLSEYSVDANEAAQLWAQADNQWKLSPAQPTPSESPSATPSVTPSETPTATAGTVVPQPPTGDTGVMVVCLVLLLGIGIGFIVRKNKITE